MNHPNTPHNQPFNVNGRRNLTKRRAWWQIGNHNNGKQKSVSKESVNHAQVFVNTMMETVSNND